MPIQDLLRPDQLAALRRLRKRIANRTDMRQRRSDPAYYKRLCIGVDLPLEAGTCGRWVNRSSSAGRCYHYQPVEEVCSLSPAVQAAWR